MFFAGLTSNNHMRKLSVNSKQLTVKQKDKVNLPNTAHCSLSTVHSSRGFTLIELLISISIIGIISAIVLTSSQAVQRSSRDAQRKADLRTIQGALQQYYADQNNFPVAGAATNFDLATDTNLTSSTGNPATPLPTPVKTYIDKLAKDPTTATTPYCYKALISSTTQSDCDNSTSQCNFYYLCAKLENADSQSVACPAIAACPSGYNFSLSPL